MSANHPRGSRLDPVNAGNTFGPNPPHGQNPTTPTGGRIVSGKTKAARAAAPAPAGGRIVSGKTKAARGVTPAQAGTSSAGGGGVDTSTDPGTNTTGKGGKTLAARKNAELIASVEKYFLLGAVIVGSIYIVRHFHLLSGGDSGGGDGGGGVVERVRYVERPRSHRGRYVKG